MSIGAQAKNMKWGLVGFINKRTGKMEQYSVVPTDSISGKLDVNSIVDVLYGKKPYRATILRLSDDQAWLNTLKPTKSGEIVSTATNKVKKKMQPNAAKKSEALKQGAKKQEVDFSSNNLSLQYKVSRLKRPYEIAAKHPAKETVDIISQNMGEQSATPVVSTLSKRNFMSHDEEYDVDNPSSMSCNSSPITNRQLATALNEIREENSRQSINTPTPPLCQSAADHNKADASEDSDKILVLLSREEYSFVTNVLRDPNIPQVTSAGLNSMEFMLRFYKTVHYLQLAERLKSKAAESNDGMSQDSNTLNPTEEDIMLRAGPGPGKVELRPGCAVYIKECEKSQFTSDWKHKPFELMRRLLRNIVGKHHLAGMAARAGGQYQPIPPLIYEAVKDYIYVDVCSKVKEVVLPSNSAYVNAVNVMCGNIRASIQKGKQSATPHQETPIRIVGTKQKKIKKANNESAADAILSTDDNTASLSSHPQTQDSPSTMESPLEEDQETSSLQGYWGGEGEDCEDSTGLPGCSDIEDNTTMDVSELKSCQDPPTSFGFPSVQFPQMVQNFQSSSSSQYYSSHPSFSHKTYHLMKPCVDNRPPIPMSSQLNVLDGVLQGAYNLIS